MGPLPWSSIDLDGQGVDVVIVSGDNLENFPLFMSSILKEKIGMDQGVFKVIFTRYYDGINYKVSTSPGMV